MIEPFEKPIPISRPVLPLLGDFVNELEDVWESKWITNLWKKHQLLEEKLREELEVPYLSLMNNGTTALMIAFKILGLEGEVITTPFTFPATVHALSWEGIEPVFCDIDPVTMNIDPNKIEELITPKTTAILPVHVFGIPCDMDRIQEIADKHGLKVVYDAAHAFGVEVNGESIGNFGDITMFSFHPAKLFHTVEGGAISFKDPAHKEKADFMRNFGIKNSDEVVVEGINGKMNEMQASMGLLVLKMIEEERRKRKILLDTYVQHLEDIPGVSFCLTGSDVVDSYQFFVVRIDESAFGRSRDYVYEKFKEYNVFTRKYFYPLCSQYPHYKDLPSAQGLKVAEQIAGEVLSFPYYGEVTVDDVVKICNILKSFR
ncbi:DegT/DnrJ/EryC1/StrS family aminotransferase [Candidatus Peregrinibacteria bacterium]|jgi:dTDP-4-amino-4,6-dideoxygalactose transaminase|nr:DegT/DnrJ/EryC1/StrS family aminotransferase [Candidatus Peregrinibacteria bacterium]MBT4056161.1 DegT/DnrJ/EryC1/StrS family aminotransferase [Candidatus Peregrinibacteria bacterium]